MTSEVGNGIEDQRDLVVSENADMEERSADICAEFPDLYEDVDRFDVYYNGFNVVFDKLIEKAVEPYGYRRVASGYYFAKNRRDLEFRRRAKGDSDERRKGEEGQG